MDRILDIGKKLYETGRTFYDEKKPKNINYWHL